MHLLSPYVWPVCLLLTGNCSWAIWIPYVQVLQLLHILNLPQLSELTPHVSELANSTLCHSNPARAGSRREREASRNLEDDSLCFTIIHCCAPPSTSEKDESALVILFPRGTWTIIIVSVDPLPLI